MLLILACAYISDADFGARMDLDGDGVSRPADCDDRDPEIGPSRVDTDGDGYGTDQWLAECQGAPVSDGGDCNDGDAEAFPGAEERCNELDDNCDGLVDNDAADLATWYPDADGDRYGSGDAPVTACTPPEGHVADGTDCDDTDATVNPGALVYRDADGDGYGDDDVTVSLCGDTTGYLEFAGDCDDSRADVNPEGVEVCDEADADEDCDGFADDADDEVTGDKSAWFVDADGDGYGDPGLEVGACDAPPGYAADGRDCDDADPGVGIECAWVDIAVGVHSCGIRGSGVVECWGPDVWGESSPPSGVFIDVDVADKQGNDDGDFSCGVREDGSLACWGGDPAGHGYLDPPPGTFTAVAVGHEHACALASDGSVACWGGSTGAVAPTAGSPFTFLTVSRYANIAIDEGGNVVVSGFAQTSGTFAWSFDDGPYQGAGGGTFYTCALRQDASLECACDDVNYGGCGDKMPSGSGYTFLDAGPTDACALDAEGAVACGSPGVSWYSPSATYTQVSVSMNGACGGAFACGILTSGGIECWDSGANDASWCAAGDAPE